MNFLYLILHACLRLRFLDVKTNPGRRHLVSTVCRLPCSNVLALPGTLLTSVLALLTLLTSVSVWHTVVLWDFGLRYASCVGVAGSRIWWHCLVVPGQDASGSRDRGIYGYGAFHQPKFECGCCECWFLGFVVRDRTYSDKNKQYIVNEESDLDLIKSENNAASQKVISSKTTTEQLATSSKQ